MLRYDFCTLIFLICLYILVSIFVSLPHLFTLTVGLMGLNLVRKKRKKIKQSAVCTSVFAMGGMNFIAY